MPQSVPEVHPVVSQLNNQGVDPTELSFMIKSKLVRANEGARDSNMIRGLD